MVRYTDRTIVAFKWFTIPIYTIVVRSFKGVPSFSQRLHLTLVRQELKNSQTLQLISLKTILFYLSCLLLSNTSLTLNKKIERIKRIGLVSHVTDHYHEPFLLLWTFVYPQFVDYSPKNYE